MADKGPVVVIVTGSWHTPEHYKLLSDKLEEAGLPTFCKQLPSNSNEIPPTKGLPDDTAMVHEQVEELADKGHPIIVLMHSYGGIVGSNALKGLSFEQRAAAGKQGGVVRLVFMCAFIIPLGKTLLAAMGGQMPPHLVARDDGIIIMEDHPFRFYNDLPKEDAEYWSSRTTLQASRCQVEDPLTYTAYSDIPVTYFACENDQALPFEVQKMMVDMCGQEVHFDTCSASHSPMLSMPEEVVKSVLNGWEMWKS